MRKSDESSLGRQLLSTITRIAQEKDPAGRRKLLRREVRLLVELGNLAAAGESADRLAVENPDWPAAHSIMADIACRQGNWRDAEVLFEKAIVCYQDAGDPEGACRIKVGPLYRLAEAAGNYNRCLSLCSGGSELESILRVRARRLAGARGHNLPPNMDGFLEQRLLLLERTWQGSSPQPLLGEALDWAGSEPEWRWRFIVESIDIWKMRKLDTRKWSKAVKNTVCPVLDPRFYSEWRNLFHDGKKRS